MSFEWLIAIRYLKAKRQQAVVSLITVISIIGVAAGVAALVVALAINAGFREELRSKLLGAQAHIQLIDRTGVGIDDYPKVIERLKASDGVLSAEPAVYLIGIIHNDTFSGDGVQVKGIDVAAESGSALAASLKVGDMSALHGNAILIGKALADRMAARVGDRIDIQTASYTPSPFGENYKSQWFDVAGIFEFGMYDLDSRWVYIPLNVGQRLMGYGNRVPAIEVRVRDVDQAPAIGKRLAEAVGKNIASVDWTETNREIFHALKLERLVMFITIGLIVLVAALNIVAMLVMMVAEKTRGIAILASMGATERMIRRIFIYQGVVIGIVGTIIGLVLGHAISYLADTYKLVSIAPELYSVAHVPFRPAAMDSVIIAAVAIAISFLATLYPSWAASRLLPVEALRYE